MIPQAFVDIMFNILVKFLEVIPDISWSVHEGAPSAFMEFISVIIYLLPVETIFWILSIVFHIVVFRIFISLIKTIWNLIPFL